MGFVWKRPPPAGPGQMPGGALPPVPPPPPQSRSAALVLILGILGVVLCCLPFGPVALLVGGQERKLVKAGRVAPSDLLTAGWILGLVGTVLFALVLIYAVFCAAAGIHDNPPPPPGGT